MGIDNRQSTSPSGAKENMSNTSGNIRLHFNFSTKDRRPLIRSEFRDNLVAYLGGIIREMSGTALIISTAPQITFICLRGPGRLIRLRKSRAW